MRRGKVGAVIGALGVVAFAASAKAQTRVPRDLALNPTKPGNDVYIDAILVGAQASYENRTDLEEGMSQIKTRVSGLATVPFADGSFNLDVSVFLYQFGFSAGYRTLFRNHQGIDPVSGLPSTHANTRQRREIEEKAKGKDDYDNVFGSQNFPYIEGRFQFVAPLGDDFSPKALNAPFMWLNQTFLRWEDRQDATFDWRYAVPHDSGVFFVWESSMLYRHRDFGAIGPAFRYLNLPRSDPEPDGNGGYLRKSRRANELFYGMTLITNPGWRAGSKDVILFQVFVDATSTINGMHVYQELFGGQWPVSILAVYRTDIVID